MFTERFRKWSALATLATFMSALVPVQAWAADNGLFSGRRVGTNNNLSIPAPSGMAGGIEIGGNYNATTGYRLKDGRVLSVLGSDAAAFENLFGDARYVAGHEGAQMVNLPAAFFNPQTIDAATARPIIQIVSSPITDSLTVTAVTFSRDFKTGKTVANARLLSPDEEGEYWRKAPSGSFRGHNPFKQFNHSHKKCHTRGRACDLGPNEGRYWYGVGPSALPVIASMLATKYSTDQVMVTVLNHQVVGTTRKGGGKIRKTYYTDSNYYTQPNYYILDMMGTSSGAKSSLYRVEGCGESNECWATGAYGLVNVNAGDWARNMSHDMVTVGKTKAYAHWLFSLVLGVALGPVAGTLDLLHSALNGSINEYYTPGRLLATGLISTYMPLGNFTEGSSRTRIVDRFKPDNSGPGTSGPTGDGQYGFRGDEKGAVALSRLNTTQNGLMTQKDVETLKRYENSFKNEAYARMNPAQIKGAYFKGNRTAESGRSEYTAPSPNDYKMGKHDLQPFGHVQRAFLDESIVVSQDGAYIQSRSLGLPGHAGNTSSMLVNANERQVFQNTLRGLRGDGSRASKVKTDNAPSGYERKQMESEDFYKNSTGACSPDSFVPC